MVTVTPVQPQRPGNSAGRFKIKPPTTTNDTGDPTDSCLFDAKRVLRLIEDERYLSAQELYHSIKERFEAENSDANDAVRRKVDASNRKKSMRSLLKRQKSTKKVNENHVKARQLLDDNDDNLTKMEDRCILFKKAKKNLDINDDWTLAQTLFGVTTYYRKESDGSLSIKLEGLVKDASLFDQVCVIREADLYSLWQPFVTSSVTVSHLGKLDTVGWFVVGLPHFGFMRDACFRAIGCDSVYEDGSVMVVAEGISDRDGNNTTQKSGKNVTNSMVSYDASDDVRRANSIGNDPILETLDLPPTPTRIGGGRMTIRSFSAQIHVESPTSATTKLVANIDPNLQFIPQSLLDFIMKRVCGVILYKMQVAARNISKDPITNLHAIKMREDTDFYKGFLLPKLKGICKIRGWQMPPVCAFELSDAQLEMADVSINKQKFKSEMKAIRLFHANRDNNLEEYLESSTTSAEVVSEKHGPRVRAIHRDPDNMSDISKNSSASSFWRSNPISNYLREVEGKNLIRKVREIEESRERAAARLKPKILNEDAITRLKELRRARDRHKSKFQPRTNSEDTQDYEEVEFSTGRKWKVSLSSHGFFTKVFVLQFLMVSLFCLLYSDPAFEKFVAFRRNTFWTERGRDLATLTYTAFAGWVHFILCYVALMYAFSTLQLGSIAGKRTRMFYSRYVHWVVGSVSGGMVGIGIAKPFIVKLLQWIVWKMYSVSKITEMYLLSVTPSTVVSSFQKMISLVCSGVSSSRTLFFESNILGSFLLSAVKFVFGFVLAFVRYPFATFTDITIKRYEGTIDTLPWREDTFYTTRALLSHSAFFLLALLILFSLTANKARKAIYIDDESCINPR